MAGPSDATHNDDMARPSEDDEGSGLPAGVMSVAAVARRLGVAPSTLRTWDRRYGLGPRVHISGAHRRYAPDDVARLLVMRRLTLEGYPPAEAARIAASESAPAERPIRPSYGEGRVLSLPGRDGTSAARGLTRAATALDFVEMARLVRDGLRSRGIDGMWHDMALPALTRIGERWQATGEGVEVEHALTQVIVSVLHAEHPGPVRPVNVRPVLLGCAEGEQHSLVLNVLDYALAEQAVMCRMLGEGMPRQAMVDAARRSGPVAVFLFARLKTRDDMLLLELPRQRPSPRVVLGGSGWPTSELPAGVRWVNSLGDAVNEVLNAVYV